MALAEKIKAGYVSPWWVAETDAAPIPGDPTGVAIVVKHVPDGGLERREFDRGTDIPEQ